MEINLRGPGLYADLTTMPIAFWHPFGRHGGEDPEEILNRKRQECADAGETFWTFRAASKDMVEFWRAEIRKHGGVVSALCIFRDSNKDTGKSAKDFEPATFWKQEFNGPQKRIHPKISATMPGKTYGAFRAAAVDVLEPHAYLRRQGKLLRPSFADPTGPMGRSQKFVRFGGGKDSREWKGEVVAILRLKEPWVVWVGKS